MVSLDTINQSNARIASSLPAGLVALFIGATKGIGQSTLEHLARHAPPAARIYSVARPGAAAAAHEELLASLRRARPDAAFTLVTADVSLVSEVDRVAAAVAQDAKKLDLLVLSAGYMPMGPRDEDTREGLDPSMTTRYYSRLRAVQLLLPLLQAAEHPRIVSVLAGGLEAPLNEADLDLRAPGAWSSWGVSQHTATMGTLALERLARGGSSSSSAKNPDPDPNPNPHLSIVHWFPGAVETPGLERVRQLGDAQTRARLQNAKGQDEAGALGLFLATSDRYAAAVPQRGLVPVPEGLDVAKISGGGIFLVDAEGESVDNEKVLAGMRQRGVDEVVWDHTLKVFAGL